MVEPRRESCDDEIDAEIETHTDNGDMTSVTITIYLARDSQVQPGKTDRFSLLTRSNPWPR
jgi:hypothetical protein